MIEDPRFEQQLRTAFASLSRHAAFTPECPAPERLWAGARGELPAAEVESLALHIADCGACAEAWRIAKDFGFPAVIPAPARGFAWQLPAAAAILLGASMSLYYITRSDVTSAPTTAVVSPAPPAFSIAVEKAPIRVASKYALTWRGPNDGQVFLEALKVALAPYERGDYAGAVGTLTALSARYPDTAEPAFYLGVSHLMTGGGAAAIAPLEQARDLADAEQHEDATWFLAAAYERAGRGDDARRLAQLICDGKAARAVAACTAAAALRGGA